MTEWDHSEGAQDRVSESTSAQGKAENPATQDWMEGGVETLQKGGPEVWKKSW